MFRVCKYAELLADLMCLDISKIKQIKKGALLHDIGKTLINENTLNKSSKLALEELKKHNELGLELLNKTDKNCIIENIILLHHEKWNGTGYPFNLKGDDIPIEVRIVSVVNYYDYLTNNIDSKNEITHEKALEVLKNESAKSFDPDIIVMFEIFESKFRKILEKFYEDKRKNIDTNK